MKTRQNQPPAPQRGFTIIEVFIVLAIVGLILLLVMQAIPTLLRTSRNNQRKQDVSAVLQAVSNFGLNHSGNFPAPADNFLQFTKLSYYDRADITTPVNDARGADLPHSTNLDAIEVRHYYKCQSNGGATSTAAGYRDIVALYAVERGGSGGITSQCQQL